MPKYVDHHATVPMPPEMAQAAIAKLVALGYPRARCEIVVQRVLAERNGDELSLEELVKEAYFSL